MKTFNKALSGLCIGLGLIVMGAILSYGIITVKDRDRIVTVKGLAEREVNADRVIWPLVFKEIGNDMTSIYNAINRKNGIVCDFLEENGITEAEISIAAPQIIDMRAERYVNSNEINYRYNVTSIITVSSGQVDKVRQLITRQADLLKKGVAITGDDYRYTTQYEFTRLNDIKPEMIEEATVAARNAAEKFAKDSDSKLGKIRRANQGQFVISDRDNNTPYITVFKGLLSCTSSASDKDREAEWATLLEEMLMKCLDVLPSPGSKNNITQTELFAFGYTDDPLQEMFSTLCSLISDGDSRKKTLPQMNTHGKAITMR